MCFVHSRLTVVSTSSQGTSFAMVSQSMSCSVFILVRAEFLLSRRGRRDFILFDVGCYFCSPPKTMVRNDDRDVLILEYSVHELVLVLSIANSVQYVRRRRDMSWQETFERHLKDKSS